MGEENKKIVMYAVPGAPIILKGTKEELATLLGCNADDFTPAFVVSLEQLKEIRKSDQKTWQEIYESVQEFRRNNICDDYMNEEFNSSNQEELNLNEISVKKIGSKNK